ATLSLCKSMADLRNGIRGNIGKPHFAMWGLWDIPEPRCYGENPRI
ncbi:unnamed protein product, partial [marine sediment metagenome]